MADLVEALSASDWHRRKMADVGRVTSSDVVCWTGRD